MLIRKSKQFFPFFFFLLILLECGLSVEAQTEGKPVFVGDLDGNGKPERIVQIQFTKPIQLPSRKDLTKRETRNGHFVKYVLYRDDEKKGITIFEYLIGDDEAVYWQYRIDEAIDLNQDSKKDLVFYAGDDTTQEYVFLIQKPDYFKAVYSGIIGLDTDFLLDFDKSYNITQNLDSKQTSVVAKWNPQLEIFEGLKIRWINQDCSLYKEKNNQSEVVSYLQEGEVIFVTDNSQNLWRKIKTPWSDGWIEMGCLSAFSPTKVFPVK